MLKTLFSADIRRTGHNVKYVGFSSGEQRHPHAKVFSSPYLSAGHPWIIPGQMTHAIVLSLHLEMLPECDYNGDIGSQWEGIASRPVEGGWSHV